MTAALRAFWWSPRRSAHIAAVELRDRFTAWAALARPLGRALTNHGDELNELVLPILTGRPVRWAPLGREDLVGIGSILGLYLEQGGQGVVLGSGAPRLDPDPARVAACADRFLAVRGPMTRDALGLDPAVQIGDPGLAVRTLGIRPASARRGRVFVPHFRVFGSAGGRAIVRAFREAGFRVMPPTVEPATMVDAIGRAETVVSSGMHGVILANALGTPVTLVSLEASTPALPAHKYRDHNASVGLPDRISGWHEAVDPARGARLHEIARAECDAISPRIDGLVDGLFAAARPLRSGT